MVARVGAGGTGFSGHENQHGVLRFFLAVAFSLFFKEHGLFLVFFKHVGFFGHLYSFKNVSRAKGGTERHSWSLSRGQTKVRRRSEA